MLPSSFPETPFQNIALCFSGGGYRAAAFCLGGLSYLRKVSFRGKPLIENVKALSTVSGGTITGVLYAYSLHEAENEVNGIKQQSNEEFKKFYASLLSFMGSEDLVDLSLKKLVNEKDWISQKNRTAINAFAKVYQERLFNNSGNATFGAFLENNTHLEEVMFNATEFDKGLAFRFQNQGRFGNYYRRIQKETVKKIRLGDIIAASSCFPIGFEPIVFPRDFIETTSGQPPATLQDVSKTAETDLERQTALMDGGIVDNQGIESIILSERRRAKLREQLATGLKQSDKGPTADFDLVIISDVCGGPSMPLKLNYSKLFLERFQNYSIAVFYSRLKLLVLIVSFVFFIPVIVVKSFGWLALPNWIENLLIIVGTTVTALFTTAWLFLRKIHNFLLSKIPSFFHNPLSIFLGLKFGLLEPMLKDRATSTFKMVSEVFMKQIRRLTYDKIYDAERWENRRIANLIYELSNIKEKNSGKSEGDEDDLSLLENRINKRRKERGLNPLELPSELKNISAKVKAVATNAYLTDTTLWFTPEDRDDKNHRHADKLRDLVSSGQFTICMNLLVYTCELLAHPRFENLKNKAEIKNLYFKLLEDWKRFNDHDQYWLYNHYSSSENAQK